MLGNALLTKYHVARAILVQQYFHKALQENDKGTSSQQPIQSCTGKWYIMHTYHIPFAREDRVGQDTAHSQIKVKSWSWSKKVFHVETQKLMPDP